MRGSICGVLTLVAVVSLAMPVLSQVSTLQTGATANSKTSPPARLPYMAEFKILRVQTLANGTAITHESTVVTARDAQGRQMTATTVIQPSADQSPITHFQVFDPMAHYTFFWSFPGRKAIVMAIPFYGAIQSGCGFGVAGMSSASEKTTVEDLGTKTILGVEARGRRTSTTILIEAIGKHKRNEMLVSNVELWEAIAPGLTGLVVREVSEDAQSGKTSNELVKFRQSEPDAAVFRPPAGYEIVNREVGIDPCTSFEGMEPSVAPTPVLPRPPAQ